MKKFILLLSLFTLLLGIPAAVFSAVAPRVPTDEPSVTEPPVERVDESAPFYRLEHAYNELRVLVDRFSGRSADRSSVFVGRTLRQAAENVHDAMDSYNGETNDLRPTHLREMFRSLIRAEAKLAVLEHNRRVDSDIRTAAEDIGRELAEVARDTAGNVQFVARRARANPRLLGIAERRILQGDVFLDRGSYVPAVAQYLSGFGLAANTIVFDPEVFEQNIRNAFENATVGYSYAINVNGQLFAEGASGLARTAADAPATPRTPNTEQHIASVSKTITAIAVLSLLEKKGISTNDLILPWIPSGWNPAMGVTDVTFEKLMRHRSRFGQRVKKYVPKIGSSSTYDGLKQIIESTPSSISPTFSYLNANYGMMRVLVPMILGFDPSTKPVDEQADFASFIYTGYLQTFYDTIGVNIDCIENQTPATRYYHFPYNNQSGWELSTDYLDGCGGYGIFSNAHDLAKILAYWRFSDKLLSPEMRKEMNSKFLGWMNPNDGYSWANGDFGVYRSHGGDWTSGEPKHGLDTCVIDFPIPVQAVVLTNSVGGNYGGMNLYQCSALVDAFDNAWVAN